MPGYIDFEDNSSMRLSHTRLDINHRTGFTVELLYHSSSTSHEKGYMKFSMRYLAYLARVVSMFVESDFHWDHPARQLETNILKMLAGVSLAVVPRSRPVKYNEILLECDERACGLCRTCLA